MGLLLWLLVTTIGVLALGCRVLYTQLGRRNEEIAQVREQFELYLSDDQRAFDELWNRAQLETARVMKLRPRL